MKDFFISYNKADRNWAEWVAWQLEEAGYSTVLQAWDSRPGMNFLDWMHQAATKSNRIIAICSESYFKGAFSKEEWTAAIAKDPGGERGTLLPILVQSCEVEGLLSTRTYLDLVGLEEDIAKEALINGVKLERIKPTTPPTFPGTKRRSVKSRPQYPGLPPSAGITDQKPSHGLQTKQVIDHNYFTLRLRITNRDYVQAEVRDSENNLLVEPSGKLTAEDDNIRSLQKLNNVAIKGELTHQDVEQFGDLLFNTLFDEELRRIFFEYYKKARQQNALLRLELDIDELKLPDLAALPWEFMRVPPSAGYGTVWMATNPNLILSRRRALWTASGPIHLKPRENLRITVAVASPEGLSPVKHEILWNSLKKLEEIERIELTELISPAGRGSIDAVLRQKPHIFHFIGYIRFGAKKSPQIALVDTAGQPDWVEADDFSELFNRHQPGIVVLQEYESEASATSDALVGIALKVVQQNIPVVAAIRYKIPNESARRFTLEFYQRLSENEPVDKAAQEGRRKITLGPMGYKTRDFAAPELFLRVHNGFIFHRDEKALDKAEINRLREDVKRLERLQKYNEAIRICKDIRDFGSEKSEIEPDIARLKRKSIDLMKQQARRMEKNQAIPDAIKTWQHIRDIDPSIEIENELERLKKKNRQKISIQEKLQELSHRMIEVVDVYKPIASRLRQLANEEVDDEGEILLQLVDKFLNNEFNAEKLKEAWVKFDLGVHSVDEPKYHALSERLNRGEIIPFLGSQILHLFDKTFPTSQDLAIKLAKEASYQPTTEPLSKISQYYQMTEYGRSTLLRSVKNIVESGTQLKQPNHLYALLVKIENPIVVISASYDSQLELLFQENQKQFVIISHSKNESGLGKIILKYSDKKTPEEPRPAETISELSLLEKGYSIIYKICGCFGKDKAEMIGDVDCVMISEDDFFSFAEQIEQVIPSYLVKQLSRQSLLFLGTDLTYWHDRLLLNAILKNRHSFRERAYSVYENPTAFESAYWKFNNIDLYEVALETFVNRLSQQMA